MFRRCQAEIDRVVGPDRLPTFADRPLLPYLDWVVWECLRWNPGVLSRLHPNSAVEGLTSCKQWRHWVSRTA